MPLTPSLPSSLEGESKGGGLFLHPGRQFIFCGRHAFRPHDDFASIFLPLAHRKLAISFSIFRVMELVKDVTTDHSHIIRLFLE